MAKIQVSFAEASIDVKSFNWTTAKTARAVAINQALDYIMYMIFPGYDEHEIIESIDGIEVNWTMHTIDVPITDVYKLH